MSGLSNILNGHIQHDPIKEERIDKGVGLKNGKKKEYKKKRRPKKKKEVEVKSNQNQVSKKMKKKKILRLYMLVKK
ncbi:hypothetical protein K502DRAFT_137139 [Neoconidiobolus thromboides FSU 785]|nr:hypothetical protein K502DRAFT_137139 [Neoconidiobolus thromboides FSU 785]